MLSSSRSDGDNSSFDVEELLQIGTRCKELRKEKDLFMESQMQGFELIKKLELHVESLSEARAADRKHIEKLEMELLNCSQEIDYLQDQLNARNADVYSLREHVHYLDLKLADVEKLQMMVDQLREELKRSDSENLFLIQELDSKDVDLRKSSQRIEKLEESISFLTLDSQCEIESMRLDIMALEQTFFEAKKVQEETALEKEGMNGLIKELEVQIHDAEEIIEHLEKENKELREKLVTFQTDGKIFIQKIEEWLEKMDRSQLGTHPCSNKMDSKSNTPEEVRMRSIFGEVLGPLFSKLVIALTPEQKMKEQTEIRLHQKSEYEALVRQLKEELKDEKLKAKEEAEDLAQEMAELRYQMTSLLEEECKRRACVEQASLQRISELEAQIQQERRKFFSAVRHLREE